MTLFQILKEIFVPYAVLTYVIGVGIYSSSHRNEREHDELIVAFAPFTLPILALVYLHTKLDNLVCRIGWRIKYLVAEHMASDDSLQRYRFHQFRAIMGDKLSYYEWLTLKKYTIRFNRRYMDLSMFPDGIEHLTVRSERLEVVFSANVLSELTHLDLQGCPLTSTPDLKNIPHLKFLNVIGCRTTVLDLRSGALSLMEVNASSSNVESVLTERAGKLHSLILDDSNVRALSAFEGGQKHGFTTAVSARNTPLLEGPLGDGYRMLPTPAQVVRE